MCRASRRCRSARSAPLVGRSGLCPRRKGRLMRERREYRLLAVSATTERQERFHAKDAHFPRTLDLVVRGAVAALSLRCQPSWTPSWPCALLALWPRRSPCVSAWRSLSDLLAKCGAGVHPRSGKMCRNRAALTLAWQFSPAMRIRECSARARRRRCTAFDWFGRGRPRRRIASTAWPHDLDARSPSDMGQRRMAGPGT